MALQITAICATIYEDRFLLEVTSTIFPLIALSRLEINTMKTVNAGLIISAALLAVVALASVCGSVYEVLFNLRADPARISESLQLAYFSVIGAASLGLAGAALAIVRRGHSLRNEFTRLNHRR